MNWLRDGDAHSKFFHGVMSSRWRVNVITAINVTGNQVEGMENVRSAMFNHFASHFKACTVERPGIDKFQYKTLSMRCGIMTTIRTLAPDGINVGFLKDFWIDIKDDVLRFVNEFHRNGRLTKGINFTFIALISKIENPQRLNDFRPISLIGSVYKVLAKLLANRLQNVIGTLISDTQTTFVNGRQILDN